MKIHIDTSSGKQPAKAQKTPGNGTPPGSANAKTSRSSGATTAQKKGGAQQAQAQAQAQTQPGVSPSPVHPIQPKPIPSKLPKETTPPDDVATARKQRSQALKTRQKIETDGTLKGPDRDNDPGTGFGPALIPYLL